VSTEISGVGQPGFVERYGLDFGSGHGWDARPRRSRPGSASLTCAPSGWPWWTSTGGAAGQDDVARGRRSRRCPTGSTSPARSTAWTPATRLFVPAFARGRRGSASRSLPGFPMWSWCPTRAPSGCCRGRTGRLDAVRCLLRQRAADAAGRPRPAPPGARPTSARPGTTTWPGSSSSFSVVIRSREELRPENAGFTPPPPPVSVFERGYQFLSEVRL